MTITHYPLDRTASHLILQLNDLRINERLADLSDTTSFAELVPELAELARAVKAQGKFLGVTKLVIAGLGGCVAPACRTVGLPTDAAGAVFAAVHVLKRLFDVLRSQFQLEIFAVTGCVITAGNELAVRASNFMAYTDAMVYQMLAHDFRDASDVVFRGFEQESLVLNAGASSFLWRYHYELDGPRDLPIQSSLTLAEALVSA